MKRMLKAIALILVTLLALVSLCSCDNLLGSTKTSEDNTNKTTKIDFAQAAENYEKKSVKKTDITVKLKGTIYANPDPDPLPNLPKLNIIQSKDKYNIGSTITVSRIQENDKIFVSSKVAPSDMSKGIDGLVLAISMALPGLSKARENPIDESTIETVVRYLTYLNRYASGSIDLGADLGVMNDTYNLKAFYTVYKNRFDQEHVVEEADDIWFAANDKTLSAWLNNNAQLEVTGNRINTYLMKTVFSQVTDKSEFFDKDNAKKYVDKNGHSSYDISLKTDIIVSSFLSGFLDLLGVADKNGALTRYAEYFSEMKQWFTVTAQNVTADVNNDLPQNIKTGFSVELNVLIPQVKEIIQLMYRNGVIDESSSKISTVILNLADHYLLGTKGQDHTIGVQFDVDFNENFSYKPSECKLSDDEYADYFLPIGVEAEGRVDLNDYVIGFIADKGAFVADYLLTLGKEYAEKLDAIREEIMQKATEIEDKEGKITKAQMLSIAAEVILKYKTDDPGATDSSQPDELQSED